MNKKGKFIVIEGIDGSGSTTHSLLLAERIRKNLAVEVLTTKEPSNGHIGIIIRNVLQGNLTLNHKSLALLFAADRLDHLEKEVIPSLEQGIWVLSDRYYLSSYAYQSMYVDLDWLFLINNFAIKPDITLFLDIPVDIAFNRIFLERSQIELFENKETLEIVRENYKKVIEKLKIKKENIVVLEGLANNGEALNIKDTADKIWVHVKQYLVCK